MGALHEATAVGADDGAAPGRASQAPTARATVTDDDHVAEAVAPERVAAKDNERRGRKGSLGAKTATAPAAEPAPPVAPAGAAAAARPRRRSPRVARRPSRASPSARPVEPRPYGAAGGRSQPPVVVALQPPSSRRAGDVAHRCGTVSGIRCSSRPQEPPPVIASQPMVTVPDRRAPPAEPIRRTRL